MAVLATVGRTGAPDLVPITFALDGDLLYTAVDHKPKSTRELRRLHNIERDPRVAVLIDRYDEDWSKLWWCRIGGIAEVVRTGQGLDAAAGALAQKYEHYRRTRVRGPAIVVRVTSWTGWSALG